MTLSEIAQHASSSTIRWRAACNWHRQWIKAARHQSDGIICFQQKQIYSGENLGRSCTSRQGPAFQCLLLLMSIAFIAHLDLQRLLGILPGIHVSSILKFSWRLLSPLIKATGLLLPSEPSGELTAFHRAHRLSQSSSAIKGVANLWSC